ncbi:MAG: hypothetical protein GY820_08780 [Gammaproteobacteria bacterium]|nr:hypothetical protein [Gammaproteobacteria bacterium]
MNNISPKKLKLPIFIIVVLTALGSYFFIMHLATISEQNPAQKLSISEIDTPPVKTQEPAKRLASVEIMISGLKQRLETQKDDINGWILLAKSYYHLNRLEEADQAFDKAIALGYTGNWKPLPRIDSFMHLGSSAQKLKALANFRARQE